MTTTELTCAHLYEVDSTFRGLVDLWDSERRCPTPLVDRCLELGLEKAADCCRWASTYRDRRVFCALTEDGERGGECGPYPMMQGELSRKWVWTYGDYNASDVPDGMDLNDDATDNPTQAILWLLDNWIIKEQQ